jgi:oxygen-dependent protoporphyrinogen oxidase
VIAVIGGGIAGMAAAWELARQGHEVTLLEASPQLSAKLSTTTRDGLRYDRGPDSYLLRTPRANELLATLDLDLVHPATSSAALATPRGRRPIPTGLVLGAPRSPRDALRSSLVGRASALRAALGALAGARLDHGDDLGAICARRYGREWTDRSIEPLVGGINANSVYGLSAATSAPSIVTLPPSGPRDATSGPAFGVPREGIAEVVRRLREALLHLGVDVRTGTPVESLGLGANGVEVTAKGATMACDGVVVALPAYSAWPLVAPIAPVASRLLSTIRYASVSMLIARTSAPAPPELTALSGILVERSMQLLTTAVSLATSKWPHWDPAGGTIIRVSTGSLLDRRHLRMSDDALAHALLAETGGLLDWRPRWEPLELVRWGAAFPHFAPYHLERVARADAALGQAAGGRIQLAGAYLRGSGIPTCIMTGRQAAVALTEALG